MQDFSALDGAILIDKPAGPTSHDVVDAIRRKFGIKKVGHCGTLDPNATGTLTNIATVLPPDGSLDPNMGNNTAVDQDQIGPAGVVTIGIFFHLSGEATAEHLAHHAEIIVGRRLIPLDVELAVLTFAETLGPGDDHSAEGVGALNMAVVVDFDAVGRPFQLK
jgi:hypothetical protein